MFNFVAVRMTGMINTVAAQVSLADHGGLQPDRSWYTAKACCRQIARHMNLFGLLR